MNPIDFDDLFDDDENDDEDDFFDWLDAEEDDWENFEEEILCNGGYFDDDGNRVYPELLVRPEKCMSCIYNNAKGMELVLCNLSRMSFVDDKSFDCGKFKAESDQAIVASNKIPLN